MSDGLLNEAAEKALRKIETSTSYHDAKDRRIKEQEDAYEGVMHPLSDAAQWESQLHPPMLNHTIETALTMLVDDSVQFKIEPLPKKYDAQEWQDAVSGAKAHEALFRRQMIADHYDEFLRPFVLQAAIRRVSIAKTYWREETRRTTRLATKKLVPVFGSLSPVRLRETKSTETVFDGPKTEVVDLRDFYWNEAAVSLDTARWCAHAIWMSPADLQQMAKEGKYDPVAVDMLVNEQPDGNPTGVPEGNEIELERERRGRKNGLIEVLEIWDRDTMTLHVLGARRVLLMQEDWPFWHQEFPFTAMSLAPFPFSIQGLSLVEKLAPLQTAFWDLLNQTRDNVKLINNAIILLASDFDDPDSFEYAPGAVNIVDNPQQVQMWQPDVNLATVAMPLLEKLQSDMQNLAMGQPLSIPMSGRITATEIATLSQIAQNAAAKMKDQITYAQRRIGYQRMRLNQQFIRKTQWFHNRGMDGIDIPIEAPFHVFQGDFEFSMDPSTESTVRAERRAEWQGLVQLVAQTAPAFAAAGHPLNMKAFMDRLLELGYDEENVDEFYSAVQPQGAPGAPQPPGGAPGQPEGAGPGGQPVGVTGPNSINPAVSPSAQGSLSPGVMLARAMASQGGFQNSGAH